MKAFFDLHLHSCLSPCGGEDMTPANLAAMCALAGLQVVALTDHNTAGNCAAFCAAAQDRGLLALAGLELCTREEIHVICLFASPERADIFSSRVDAVTAPWPLNDPEIYGRQVKMDRGDTVLGEDTRLLAGATGMAVVDVAAAAAELGGVCYPAHIDRPSFSLLTSLGVWDPALGFPLVEVTAHCPPDFLQKANMSGVRHIVGSDAHYLHQVPDAAQTMDLDAMTASSVLDWLKN